MGYFFVVLASYISEYIFTMCKTSCGLESEMHSIL